MNVKEEFITHVKDRKVLCASIVLIENEYYDNEKTTVFDLSVGHSEREYELFLDDLCQYNYDSGYGSQELNGIIWYQDKSFSDRGEYDGSEWWEHQKTPSIPNKLFKHLGRV